MPESVPETSQQLFSLVTEDGTLELYVESVDIKKPCEDEVVVRIEAAPINPSDLGLLLGASEVSSAKRLEKQHRRVTSAEISERAMRAMKGRIGQPIAVGNEGCGTVVGAGSSSAAQALIGRRVGVMGGATYAQYRNVKLRDCLTLPEGTSARDGASCFVNPLMALAMVEVVRREGHKALVHTAAASNLGQMLVRLCLEDGIPLVNVVRSETQAQLMRDLGATHVVDTSSSSFFAELTDALADTGATLAFDAVGGGKLAGQILTCMEAATSRDTAIYRRYGSDSAKQVYIYGSLDMSPTILTRSFGLSWGVNGFLLPQFLASLGSDDVKRMKARVVEGLTATFASRYSGEISLEEMLDPETIQTFSKRSTGEKYLVRPHGR